MPASSPGRVEEKPTNQGGNGSEKPRSKRADYSQKSGSYLPDIHRALPQSLDAEKGLLGSVLLSTSVLDDCIAQIDAKHFHLPAHQKVFEVLVEMRNLGKPIDLISLTQTLEDRKLLEEVGGAALVTDLLTFVPTAANADYYRDILREKHLLRQVIAVCTEYAARSYEEQGDVKTLLDEVEQRVLAIGDQRFRDSLPTMKEMVNDAITNIEQLIKNKGGITGLSTGFAVLDRMTSGLHEGEMFVIAARPSMGKTALAMNIAEHVALDANKPVAVFSLEMSAQQLVQRLLCSRARVNSKSLRDGFIGKADMNNISAAATLLTKAKIFVDDTPGLTILELRAKARRLRDREGIELVVIDYLQLLRSPSKRGQDNRQIEIAEISYGIKALSKELRIPVIVLAQLNRNPEQRTGESKGRPRLSDLRESGTIEQDADVVGLLVREKYYAEDDEARKEAEGKATLIIAKQRNGPTGDVPLTFLEQFTRFEDRAEERTEE
ncbi:MAG: replicative DNA helicase [Terrimicrobiaceae bacterium]|nr:replicative DNA helicase [Terrimicrobiaceae bacterium]